MKPSSPEHNFLHYLPYSEEDEKTGMVCSTVGCTMVPPKSAYPPYRNEHPAIYRTVAEGRTLPDLHIVYITEGKGHFEAEGMEYDVSPGSAFLLLPNMKHRYAPDFETGWYEYWVGFRGNYFDRLLENKIISHEKIFFDMGKQEYIEYLFRQILDEVKTLQPLYQLKICSRIITLLTEILAWDRRREQPDNYQTLVTNAKKLMEAAVMGSLNLGAIANELGVSTSWLNQIFKEYTSMTPYQYYIHLKICKAQELLEQPGISVKEAAWQMGFDDQYSFSRLFKSKTGISPRNWKRLPH
jgi:AraC-like DNA-binding protein